MALALATPLAAVAAVVSVQVSPDPILVNARGTGIATVRWTVQVSQTASPSPVTSTEGEILVNGVPLETPGGVLTRSITSLGVTTARFTERIRISREAVNALRSGASVTYSRTFADADSGQNLQAGVDLSGLGALAIVDATVRFDDDSLYRVVAEGDDLRARARLSTAGRGIFDGTWEVSGPTGASTGTFRPISRTRRNLAGARSTVFESPDLPTDRPGLYFVRLVPDPSAQRDTANTFNVLRYYVLPGPDQTDGISLITPQPGARVTTSTRFSWSPVDGADRYRIEFLGDGSIGLGGRRVAALDLGAQGASTQLRPFTVERIRREGATLWRVLAFDDQGRLLSASPARDLGGGTLGSR